MSKISIIQRELKRKKLIKKYLNKRKLLKNKLKINKSLIFIKKLNLILELDKLPLNSSTTRFTNRCWKTGRANSTIRWFGLCRHIFREFTYKGYLPGIIKK